MSQVGQLEAEDMGLRVPSPSHRNCLLEHDVGKEHEFRHEGEFGSAGGFL